MNKKKDENKENHVIDEEKLKYEIAKELGLIEKINRVGWAGLTAKESGKIGGIITAMKKQKKNKSDLESK
ncbi:MULTISPECIES: small, acid-soluble spore protein, alpha/beta type [Tissierellales]|jgi:uncharacterized membrane protein YkgB|uniref:Small, acid-soluble spore protein, alpha/beta type n=1 Tax=Acidilutibacter cellobiosedens TaxID=2507161 RepID=A0A410QBE9_9FIRM|nr:MULTISPECIES: small, acid-soluble spore protein, alpha/beta type [Tissierellales]MBE6082155.1 small, acid-soluble spore protein, alpha/beta type [Tissierellaceae bacterium]QAT61325.1 small, acid-soluble spore protein, alpha/beta type [Acidilutibacter cellobiosedens]SCL95073.1 Small, acid-soluble spore proteins, alpha/beta type [Sporanaerobacter sp. PP17-6a]